MIYVDGVLREWVGSTHFYNSIEWELLFYDLPSVYEPAIHDYPLTFDENVNTRIIIQNAVAISSTKAHFMIAETTITAVILNE